MNIYNLSRIFWDYCFENTGKIKPVHISIYFFAIEHCNRLGWKKQFGFPTAMVLDAINIKSYSVYKAAFDDLVSFGFFEVVEYSKNQYSSNIIALKENNKANYKANTKALDKAMLKHVSKQHQSTSESTDSIDIPITNLPIYEEEGCSTTPKPQFGDCNLLDVKSLNEKLFSDEGWIEATAMNLKITIDEVKNAIPAYLANMVAGGANTKTLKDAKSHFNNWFRKRNESTKNLSNGKSNNGTTKEKPIYGRLTKSEIEKFMSQPDFIEPKQD